MIARRNFLAGAGALLALQRPALAAPGGRRVLALDNIHTGEKLAVDYWVDGQYQPEAMAAVNHLLRDFRTGDVHPIAPALLDLLAVLHGQMETKEPFSVISGYRSPHTNAGLRDGKVHSGVAVNSLHMQGQAIDVRIAGRPLDALRRAALALRAGGVGYYPQPDFVHVDVGRIRTW